MQEHTQCLIEVFGLSWETPLLGLAAALLGAICVMLLEAMGRGSLSLGPRWWVIWGLAAVSMAVLMLLEVVNFPIWNDEVEHLHCAWLMFHGAVPWRDFWQHHPPGLWQMLAPLVGALPESPAALWAVRAVALGLVVCGLVVAGLVPAGPSYRNVTTCRRLTAVGLLCGSFAPASFAPWIHAENVAGALVAVGLVVGWLALERKSVAAAAVTGGLWSAAAVLTPKLAPLALMWPVAGCWVMGPKSRGAIVKLLAGWLLGASLPVAAQAWWLVREGVWRECLYWCFRFNRPQWGLSRATDLAIVAATFIPVGLLWAWGLRALQGTRWWGYHVLLASGALAGFLCSPVYWGYSAWGLYVVMVPPAVIGLERLTRWLQSGGGSGAGRGVACCAVLAVLCTGMCATVLERVAADGFAAFVGQSRAMGRLMELGRGRTVLCVIPDHPIFSRDATAVWHSWQLLHAARGDVMHEEAVQAAEALGRGEPDMVGAAAAREVLVAAGSGEAFRRWRKAQESYEPVMNGHYLRKRAREPLEGR